TQRLFLQSAHFGAEKFIDQLWRIDFLPGHRFFSKPAAELESSRELHCFCRPNAMNADQLLCATTAQPAQRLVPLQKLSANFNCVCAFDAGPKQDCEQLAVS